MKNKILGMVIVIAVFLSAFSINASATEAANLSGGQILKQYILQNSTILQTSEKKELSLEEESSIKAMYISSYIQNNDNVAEKYGGCYIDSNGELHILFVSGTESSIINKVKTMAENDVVNDICEYSLEELNSLKEYISNLISNETTNLDLANIKKDIVGVGIYEQYNKVFVEIRDCDSKKVELFKNLISSSEAIVFEDAENYEKQATYLKPGSEIAIGTSSGNKYSIGFRCKRLTASGSYNYGFVTSAHGNSRGQNVYVSNTYIGFISVRSLENNGTADGAFVYVVDDNYEPSNTVAQNGKVLTAGAYVNSFVTGKTVYKAGKSTNLTSGKITSTSYNCTIDGITTKDCVQAAYKSDSGDSGGVVYMTVDGSNFAAGIHMAGATNADSAVFVKAANLKSALDIILY